MVTKKNNADMKNEPEVSKSVTLNKLLPNLMTIFAICIGLSAIRFAMIGKWETAVLCIFAAGILDNLDGRLARLLNAQTKFGAELDSLADMVNFGVVPALINYFWSLDTGGKFVWFAVLIYTICMSLRLARFNARLHEPEVPEWASYNFFMGVPAPAAAALSFIPMMLFFEFKDLRILQNPYTVTLWMIFISALMVSNLPSFSFKNLRIPSKYIIPTMIIATLVVTSLILNTWISLLIIGAFYFAGLPFAYSQFRTLRKKALEMGVISSKTGKRIHRPKKKK